MLNPDISLQSRPALRFLSFKVGKFELALAADRVERVVRAVWIIPVPEGPGVLLGIANVAGKPLPVLDTGLRMGEGPTRIHSGLIFILAQSALRRLILVADSVSGLIEGVPADFTAHDQVAPGIGRVAGMLKREDGLIWIQDPDRFLSLGEEAAIDNVLAPAAGYVADEAGSDAA
jgi:purine-binding chemotaxis protein CheW